MSQERDTEELLSAEEIAERIGMFHVTPMPPAVAPARPGPSTASSADSYGARLLAVRRALSRGSIEPAEAPPADVVPDWILYPRSPRRLLLRDSAATLAGLSAVVLIVIAVLPPSPNGGVLGATASPPRPSAAATAPSSTPEPSPTSLETPALAP